MLCVVRLAVQASAVFGPTATRNPDGKASIAQQPLPSVPLRREICVACSSPNSPHPFCAAKNGVQVNFHVRPGYTRGRRSLKYSCGH